MNGTENEDLIKGVDESTEEAFPQNSGSEAEAESAVITTLPEEPEGKPVLTKKEIKRAKKAEKKQKRKDRRKHWKEERKRRREQLKENYRYAPLLLKVLRLYLIKPIVITVIAVHAVVLALLIGFGIYFLSNSLYQNYVYENRNEPVEDIQLIYNQSPIDEEGAKRIEAMEPNAEDDTWTFCVYFIASNLEDNDENDLSETTKIKIHHEREEREAVKEEKTYSLLSKYESELKNSGLELPDFLYYPSKPIAYSETVMNEVVVTDEPGCASVDINEIVMNELSDRISVVMQTGGATRWENTMVNPNRTQRFVYQADGFEEVANLPLERSTDPETLADFIKFCKQEYPADHMVLILWDHGGGPFGYGSDSIFGGEIMSLADIRSALELSCRENIEEPPFDIIAFDACLMSTIEVTHSLDGFSRYYVLSEESEPGEGWDYSFLQTLAENPEMSTAAVGREITDKYMDFYMTQNVNLENFYHHDITMALLDARKCEEVYDAYSELAKKQLIDSADDLSVLAGIGRAAVNSTHFAQDGYNYYNQVDLANYVDHLAVDYPEECSRIAGLIDEAVIYHRENGSLSDSEGIAAYVPGYMDSYDSLYLFLKYEYYVCEDSNVRDLYFYKIAGCLTDEMKAELRQYTDKEPRTLDTSVLHDFEKTEPVIDDDGYSIPVSDEQLGMIQNYDYSLYLYDEDLDCTTYYGCDELAYPDGEGNIRVDFDGTWIFLDKVPLAIQVVSSTSSTVDYISRIDYNGLPAYLQFSYDRDSEEFTIKGVRLIPEDDMTENFLVNSNNNKELQKGDRITPIYPTYNYEYNSEGEKSGKTVKFGNFTKIKEGKLDSGKYLGMIVIYDQRGDSYFGTIVDNYISGKKVKERKVDEDFYGTGY